MIRALFRRQAPPRRPAGRLPTIVLGSPNWALNGVNVFSENLCRALLQRGHDARILVTESASILVRPHDAPLDEPTDLPFQHLDVGYLAGWGAHWRATVDCLESLAPCIYVPNSDWRHSCVAPRLSRNVGVVGIVHSDDPLHYDHVARMGASWNRIVCVSETVARRTAAQNPGLADRLDVVPIGVRIPPSCAHRAPTNPAAPLRVLYLGALKQHQKRVLDLPEIASLCAARGIALHLTIAGDGTDAAALRAACAPLVEQGLVSFAGVVARDGIDAILDRHDVFILTSAFEGMPNALLEAMGRGCVPLVTRIDSAVPELVDDGTAGFVVAIGDYAAFADRLGRLAADRALLSAMAQAAHRRVAGSVYTLDSMVERYLAVFEQTAETMASARWTRPAGEIVGLPDKVAGIGIFPIPCPVHVPGVGHFPSLRDARDFQAGAAAPPAVPRAAYGPVLFGAPNWGINGVNQRAGDLAAELIALGQPAGVVITEEESILLTVDNPRQALPQGVPSARLPLDFTASWGARWGALLRLLTDRAPCVYLPGYDWRLSAIVPLLPDNVLVVATMDGIEPLYDEQLQRLADGLNLVVAGSSDIARHVATRHPLLADRVQVLERMLWQPKQAPMARSGPIGIGIVGETPARRAVARAGVLDAAVLAGLAVHVQAYCLGHRPGMAPTDAQSVSRLALRRDCARLDALLFADGLDDQLAIGVEAIAAGCLPVLPTDVAAIAGMADTWRDWKMAVLAPQDLAPGTLADVLRRIAADRDGQPLARAARLLAGAASALPKAHANSPLC